MPAIARIPAIAGTTAIAKKKWTPEILGTLATIAQVATVETTGRAATPARAGTLRKVQIATAGRCEK